MVRWALSWLTCIALATAVFFWWTNTLVTRPQDLTVAMLPLDQLGSPACTRATRELVAAADGAADDATVDQRHAWDSAAAAVLAACRSA